MTDSVLQIFERQPKLHRLYRQLFDLPSEEPSPLRPRGSGRPGRSLPEMIAFLAAKATCSGSGVPGSHMKRNEPQLCCVTCYGRLQDGQSVQPYWNGRRSQRLERVQQQGSQALTGKRSAQLDYLTLLHAGA
jgi:hypothetical protein